MSVLTFSRQYPAKHPRAGERTLFPAKIIESLLALGTYDITDDQLNIGFMDGNYTKFDVPPKVHTIRAGFRFKVGDWFTPRVWGEDINPKSGRSGPYQSKQITFAPDIQIKKIWTFAIGKTDYYLDGRKLDYNDLRPIAKNDGLAVDDFERWFDCHPKAKNGFAGQILCWNEEINY